MTTDPQDRVTADQVRVSPVRESRRAIVVIGVLSLINGAFETLTIVSIVAFIDGVTSGNLRWEIDYGPLEIALGRSDLAAIGAASLALLTVTQMLSGWLSARAVAGWRFKIQTRAIRAFLETDWQQQTSETSGSLQNLLSLCGNTTRGLSAAVTMLASAGAVLVFATGAFVASPLAAAILLGTGVASMIALRPVRIAAREATREMTLEQRTLAERVGEIHDLAQEIRVQHVERRVFQRVRETSWRVRCRGLRASLWSTAGDALYRSLGLGLLLAGAAVASGLDDLDVARVGVAGLLLLRSIGYGQRIQSAWQTIETNRPYIEQVSEALTRYESRRPQRGSLDLQAIHRIDLTSCSYSYDGDMSTAALKNVGLHLERGETLGVVGPSGSGKSTLAQILLGLREPTSGSFEVDGVPSIEVSARAWFRLVSVVPQQPRLLRATVLENIQFDRDWISRHDAIEAAVAAGLHEEIMDMPEGYETAIGSAVRDLTGGQRQRLGIARALAGRPQLLVLDEPTSALDALSEGIVQETLAKLRGNVTVVIIAHRLATLNSCDRILVLQAGAVSALDAPTVVLAQNEFFRQAVEMQLVTGHSTDGPFDD